MVGVAGVHRHQHRSAARRRRDRHHQVTGRRGPADRGWAGAQGAAHDGNGSAATGDRTRSQGCAQVVQGCGGRQA
ncbi:MAG TPA: hypothetical protein VIL36_00685 [Acidimicrobiales bacterium]